MSKSENQKHSDAESVDTREQLVTSNENDDQEKMLDKDSDKTDKNENNNGNGPNDEMNGSTVEIVQPADLKPKNLGFTRTLLLAMFAAMIGTGAQYGYALGVMNAPSEVRRMSKRIKRTFFSVCVENL